MEFPALRVNIGDLVGRGDLALDGKPQRALHPGGAARAARKFGQSQLGTQGIEGMPCRVARHIVDIKMDGGGSSSQQHGHSEHIFGSFGGHRRNLLSTALMIKTHPRGVRFLNNQNKKYLDY